MGVKRSNWLTPDKLLQLFCRFTYLAPCSVCWWCPHNITQHNMFFISWSNRGGLELISLSSLMNKMKKCSWIVSGCALEVNTLWQRIRT